jgi:CRISPR type I-E-associated protein CasB/Cse2
MTSTTSSPGMAARDSIAGQLHARLHALEPRAERHAPEALRAFAELRRGVGHRFGDVAGADAALLGLIHFPPDEDGLPPRMTPQLGRLLDDALMVASLAAFGRPAVAPTTSASASSGRRSFGTDCRPLRATRPTAAEALFRSILGAEREDLDVHLRRAIVLLGGDGHLLDVASLVRDLGRWGYDARPVQKRWAYDFWAQSGTEFDDATKGKT